MRITYKITYKFSECHSILAWRGLEDPVLQLGKWVHFFRVLKPGEHMEPPVCKGMQCALESKILYREPEFLETWTNPSVCGSDLIAGTSMCYPHHPWGKPTVLFPGQSLPVQTIGQQRRCTPLFPSLWELLMLYGSMSAESDTDPESQQLPAQWKFKSSWVLHTFVFLLFCIVFFSFPHHFPFSELSFYNPTLNTRMTLTVLHLKTNDFRQNVLYFKLW